MKLFSRKGLEESEVGERSNSFYLVPDFFKAGNIK